MRIKTIIILLSTLVIVSFSTHFIYKKFFRKIPKPLFKTEKPQNRNIFQIVNATGTLDIKDHQKIGSLVAGRIQEILVKENTKVEKGQLLALIDDGKGDTDVKAAEGELNRATASLDYQKKYFQRQKQLFETEQISKDFFEKVEKDYLQAIADVKTKKAQLEKSQIVFNNKKIEAPTDGIIVSIEVTIGQTITTDLDATVLFKIAKDITQMEAALDIDESDIGNVKEGQKVLFTVGTYPDRIFKGTIYEVSFSPKRKNNILTYKARVGVNNANMLLRPGMTVNAKINVAKGINCLSLIGLSFQINPTILKGIAKKLKYKFVPLERKNKKNMEKRSVKSHPIKFVWVVEDNSFIEEAIEISVTDDNYFEVKSGVDENDNVIIDIKEPDDMEKFYKKFFKSSF